jgi:hypothetical protein
MKSMLDELRVEQWQLFEEVTKLREELVGPQLRR